MGSRYRPHTTHLSAPRCRRQHEILPQLCWYDCWCTWCRIAWQGRLLIRRIHQGSYHEVETAQQILLHAPSLKSSDRLRSWDVASCPCLLLAAATAARTDQATSAPACALRCCAHTVCPPRHIWHLRTRVSCLAACCQHQIKTGSVVCAAQATALQK